MKSLSDLIAEREPDPDALERERRIPVTPYRDPDFYRPLEQLTLSCIEATFASRVLAKR